MFNLNRHHKQTLRHHGEKVSQKLTNLVHESHFRKVILHNRKEERLMQFPLLLGIIILLLFPLLVTFALLIFFLYGGNLIVEREE